MTKTIPRFQELIKGRQHNRMLRLSFPHRNAPDAQMVVDSIDAVESISRDFEYKVKLLSDDPCIALKDMQGKLLNIELVRADGSLRYFSGYVFSFRRCHADGGIALYEATLGPWLRFLKLRKDNYVFHYKSLKDQTSSIFRDYSAYPNWEWQIYGGSAAMTYACQFDETDFNYLSRRWEAAGWIYSFRHDEQGHTLIIADDPYRSAPIDGDLEVRFHAQGGSVEEDAIDRWVAVRELVPSSFSVSSYNFCEPRQVLRTAPTLNQQGSAPRMEQYEYAGSYGCKNFDDAYGQAKLRMEEIEAVGKYFEAEGNCRTLEAGRYFRLVDHFNHERYGRDARDGRNDFLVLSIRHRVCNNYLAHDGLAEPTYRNWFTCSRRSVQWRPGRGFNSTDTRILAPQTATVVGIAGRDRIHTDPYGRVRVQFHWDRVGQNDAASSAWIRVSALWAGPEMGSAAVPRLGTEVIVQWLSGDPDRPIITGAVANEDNKPAWMLPDQRALSGLRSRELTPNNGQWVARRGNHLVFDDTFERIQAQLKSDHQCSQLSLGYVKRIQSSLGVEDARGEGWELATNAWGVARAGKGMLITTEARRNAAGPIKDLGETHQRLASAQQAQERHARFAEQCTALDPEQQSDILAAIKTQTDDINGRKIAADHAFPELSAPHLVLASPAGIASTTAGSTHLASDGHTVISTGKTFSLTSGEGFFASVRKTLRLLVHQAGMKLVAAAGDIDVQALNDSIRLLAKLKISQTANEITITAQERIVINGGGSYANFSAGGIELGTNGSFVVHAASDDFNSPKNMDAKLVIPTHGGFDNEGAFLFSA